MRDPVLGLRSEGTICLEAALILFLAVVDAIDDHAWHRLLTLPYHASRRTIRFAVR